MSQTDNQNDSIIFVQNVPPQNELALDPNVPQQNIPSEHNKVGKTEKKSNSPPIEVDEQQSSCPICFESWTSTGSHRICTLRCGHLFGKRCIERWLYQQASNPNKPRCPQCNARAHRKDIVNIYATNFSVLDPSELDRYKQELESEKSLRLKSDRLLSIANNRLNMLTSELDIMRTQNNNLQKKLNLLTQCQMFINGEYCPPGTYEPYADYRINSGEGCRLVHWPHGSSFLLVSKPSPTQSLLPGQGVYKVSFLEMEENRFHSEYIKLHSAFIRDISTDPNDQNVLLSCSQDKTIRLTNTHHISHIHSYHASLPVWSCHWDANNSNIIYAGLNDGTLIVYDIRNTIDALKKLNLTREYFDSSGIATINKKPIVSIKSLSVLDKNNSPMYKGLVAATFDGVYFVKTGDTDYSSSFVLSTQGAVVYLTTSTELESCVVTQRPSKACQNVQHFVGDLTEGTYPSVDNPKEEATSVSFKVSSQFTTGSSCTVMNRSSIYTPDGKSALVAVGNEDNKSIHIYDINTEKAHQVKSKFGIVIDVVPIWYNNIHFLAASTTTHCLFYKYRMS